MHLGILAMQNAEFIGSTMFKRLNPATTLLDQTFHSIEETENEDDTLCDAGNIFDDSVIDPDHELNISTKNLDS
jgi:hypothetical protein